MAEFSKQYVENFESEIGGWDFDIEAVAKELNPGFYVHYICEGFGFVAIGKTIEGEINLVFMDDEKGEFIWKSLEETIEETRNIYKNEI